jgi:hypothetical protein
LGIESGTGASGKWAASILGVGVAVYLLSLSAIQTAAPRGLRLAIFVRRMLVIAVAVVVALLGSLQDPALLTTALAGALLAQIAFD